MIDLVKYPVITEKYCRLIENNQYTFDVDSKLTKTQIKKIFKDVFQVDVISVNTHRPPRLRFKKRVIITIKSNQSIPIFVENE